MDVVSIMEVSPRDGLQNEDVTSADILVYLHHQILIRELDGLRLAQTYVQKAADVIGKIGM